MGPRLAEEWLSHVKLFNIYGVTECMGYQTSCRVTSASMHANLGRVLASKESCRVLVVPLPESKINPTAPARWYELPHQQQQQQYDTDTLSQDQQPLPTGGAHGVKRGEIWIVGQQVGAGYLGARLASASSEVFPQHATWGSCYRTGDLAAVQADGSVVLIGRSDWQVKIRGIRTEVAEIEAALSRLFIPTLVTAIAAVPVPATAASQPQKRSSQVRICAVVVPKQEEERVVVEETSAAVHENSDEDFCVLADSPALDLLRSVLRQESHRRCVPLHMIPTYFCFANRLPVTRTGKLNRKMVFERVQMSLVLEKGLEMVAAEVVEEENDDDDNKQREAKQLTQTESMIAQLWAEELGLSHSLIHSSSHFGALGGDSLAALRICLRLAAAQEAHCNSSSTSSTASEPNNEFGQLLGPLSPGFLLKQQVLSDFARHVESHISVASYSAPVQSRVPSKIEPAEESGETVRARELLYRAVSGNRAAVVDYLLQAFASDDQGTTSPAFITIEQHPLLREGASNCKRKNLLHLASFNGNQDIVRLFLSKTSFSLTSRDPSGASLLHAATHAPTDHVFALLVSAMSEAQVSKHQHPLFYLDENKQSVLHHAARFGAPLGIVRQIVALEEELGSNSSKKAKSKTKTFAMAKPMVTWTDKWSRTPLHWASVNGHAVLVSELLRMADLDLSARDSDGETALDIAERRAKCGATDRQGERASKWGSIARLLGGSGTTDAIRARAKA